MTTNNDKEEESKEKDLTVKESGEVGSIRNESSAEPGEIKMNLV
eukprot:CAMPEP_0170534830 /NCGR_PEP_ID=MMETSP0209-20121228/95264_1 /TAXON_ID=665100 ORGANISM="Litonotus pictus, Strain P1" /NCGR_SAMPLE_ID=MMETSP0209 /ASSEMBLY_ACC=CAM_ASM_000301 /LENGTH=43 /DNA_ID= /DNA_START= /DNA_END= /DNA_ORIENTATION=